MSVAERVRAAGDHYDVLGLSMTAATTDIRAAYRELALVLHPDKGGEPELFLRVQAAWEILGDDEQRAAYDGTLVVARLLRAQQHLAEQRAADAAAHVVRAHERETELERRRAAIRASQLEQDAILRKTGHVPTVPQPAVARGPSIHAFAAGIPFGPGMFAPASEPTFAPVPVHMSTPAPAPEPTPAPAPASPSARGPTVSPTASATYSSAQFASPMDEYYATTGREPLSARLRHHDVHAATELRTLKRDASAHEELLRRGSRYARSGGSMAELEARSKQRADELRAKMLAAQSARTAAGMP